MGFPRHVGLTAPHLPNGRLVGPSMKMIMAVALLVSTLGAVTAGTAAAADPNPPETALTDSGQTDNPLEDVLEHTLNFGDAYTWD